MKKNFGKVPCVSIKNTSQSALYCIFTNTMLFIPKRFLSTKKKGKHYKKNVASSKLRNFKLVTQNYFLKILPQKTLLHPNTAIKKSSSTKMLEESPPPSKKCPKND